MMHKLLLPFALVCVLGAGGSALAQVDKTNLVRQIIVAQGLLDFFEQQMTQQREATRASATQMFEAMFREAGGQPTPKAVTAFERLVVRSAEIFTAQELVDAWSAEYGRELSTSDLTSILAYYESPIGKKDVSASKAAMARFSQWATQQGLARSSTLLTEFISELKAAQP